MRCSSLQYDSFDFIFSRFNDAVTAILDQHCKFSKSGSSNLTAESGRSSSADVIFKYTYKLHILDKKIPFEVISTNFLKHFLSSNTNTPNLPQ